MKTWLTVAEGAEYAGVSRDTIYTACEQRELPHARLSGRRAIRLRREWIDGWLEQHMRGVQPERTGTDDARSQAVDAKQYADARIERTRAHSTNNRVTPATGRPAYPPDREYRDGC
jgi:excisionase family DNA binding protein